MDTNQAVALFDGLPAVALDEMIGTWDGTGFPTGHRLDGLLENMGWRGKRFISPDVVHPLVFCDSRGEFPVDPSLIPTRLVPHLPLTRGDFQRRLVGLGCQQGLMRMSSTRRPGARLRLLEHRGVLTAGMVYDALPIIDHFRRLDEDTLLGLMDARGQEPFFFQLRRR